jgi:predicted transcriptional regulator
MPRTPRDVTEAELGVLRVLWEEGPSSVRRIAERLEEQAGTPTQAATVQKLLERLERKGWVSRDRSGEVQRFAATADRDELIGRRLQVIAEQLCEGSLTPLLSHLVKRERLSASDRQALRDLIEKLADEPRGTKSKRA